MEQIKPENLKNSLTKSVPLTRIGNFIKEARISRNKSINELSSNLKISENYLKAIEEGREDLLNEKVFIKAMVRRISEKLKLDTQFIMGEFENKSEEIEIEDIVEEVKQDNKLTKKPSISFFIFIVISGLVGLLASYFIFNFINDIKNQSDTKALIKSN